MEKIPIKIDFLNHSKKKDAKANIEIDLAESKNNIYIKKIKYKSKIAELLGEEIYLDRNNKVTKFNKISVLLQDNRGIDNDLKILRKKNIYYISGKNFAIDKFLEDTFNGDKNEDLQFFDNNERIFNLSLYSAYIDNQHSLFNLKGQFNIKNNKIINLELKSNFKNNKSVKLSIKTFNNNTITTFYSELAKPFVKKFKFIKGFEGGEIDFTSTKNNNISNSVLKIYDFKLKELPVLTKILTLASLQGISDLLTGDGVRFDEFEMLFSNEEKLITIEEVYSIGPAISILMDGYVQKDEIISLRGTLVPATTINKFVASIPVLGEILVGKKTGEGVFGVSFKIKGKPNDLKTSVNPIKTLTPRFITRTLEKIKKTN